MQFEELSIISDNSAVVNKSIIKNCVQFLYFYCAKILCKSHGWGEKLGWVWHPIQNIHYCFCKSNEMDALLNKYENVFGLHITASRQFLQACEYWMTNECDLPWNYRKYLYNVKIVKIQCSTQNIYCRFFFVIHFVILTSYNYVQ